MKANQVYVGNNGVSFSVTSGNVVAIYPATKDHKYSYLLLENGGIRRMEGLRVNGVGIPRFAQSQGFELAQDGDVRAEKLADYVDCLEGCKLVEKASQIRAIELQTKLGGQECTIIPFDETVVTQTAKVSPRSGFTSTVYDLQTGFNSGNVDLSYDKRSTFGMGVQFHRAWLVDPDESFPRPQVTEYGGLVETAIYTICNAGLATLTEGNEHIVMNELASLDDPFPRGAVNMTLTNGDVVCVGIGAADETVVQYHREGKLLYTRTGFEQPRLGEVIGAIAAVIVRVSEMDAPVVKKRIKKAA